jgi:hypothetical protein
MARYIGPKSKIARKFKEPILGFSKALQKKNYPPGQHGASKRRKKSEYSIQLQEKQKAKYTYGLLEKQFENFLDPREFKLAVITSNDLDFSLIPIISPGFKLYEDILTTSSLTMICLCNTNCLAALLVGAIPNR